MKENRFVLQISGNYRVETRDLKLRLQLWSVYLISSYCNCPIFVFLYVSLHYYERCHAVIILYMSVMFPSLSDCGCCRIIDMFMWKCQLLDTMKLDSLCVCVCVCVCVWCVVCMHSLICHIFFCMYVCFLF